VLYFFYCKYVVLFYVCNVLFCIFHAVNWCGCVNLASYSFNKEKSIYCFRFCLLLSFASCDFYLIHSNKLLYADLFENQHDYLKCQMQQTNSFLSQNLQKINSQKNMFCKNMRGRKFLLHIKIQILIIINIQKLYYHHLKYNLKISYV